jgi:hypothetical protein
MFGGARDSLGEIKDDRAVKPLAKALYDENGMVREAAKEALEKIKAKKDQGVKRIREIKEKWIDENVEDEEERRRKKLILNDILKGLGEKAREGKYKGITLVADKDTPAFSLYLKEGYIVDREFKVGERTLCWMRSNYIHDLVFTRNL